MLFATWFAQKQRKNSLVVKNPTTIFALTAVLLCGCSTLQTQRCSSHEQAAISELIYFGTAKPGGMVTAQEWSDFLAQVVTPRFPAGLSVWPAAGQWQSADGSLTRENSFVLNLIHAEDELVEQNVVFIVNDYKTRFRQEAVLRVKSMVCTSL